MAGVFATAALSIFALMGTGSLAYAGPYAGDIHSCNWTPSVKWCTHALVPPGLDGLDTYTNPGTNFPVKCASCVKNDEEMLLYCWAPGGDVHGDSYWFTTGVHEDGSRDWFPDYYLATGSRDEWAGRGVPYCGA
ncbi:hypothetical protein GCM10010174_24300 [Kutzneria viridogrisea]